MASSNRGPKILSAQHGMDVSIVISTVYVYTPTNGPGVDQIFSIVSLEKIGNSTAYLAGHGTEMAGMKPRLVRAEYPTGETQRAATFINQFMATKSDFPFNEFYAIGFTLQRSNGD